MSNDLEEEQMSIEELEKERHLALRAVLSFVSVLVIMGVTIFLVWTLELIKPTAAKKTATEETVRKVEVVEVQPSEGGVRIFAEGVVESQQVVDLTAEVSGKLIEVNGNLVPGGKVARDEVLVRIDPADFRAALEQAKAAQERSRMLVADAQLVIEQEVARRDQALRDWKELGRGEPSELLARVPQIASAEARLVSAKADVESAAAEVEQAQRNLGRTVIRAPFSGVVRRETVEVGAVLAPGTVLATLFSERSLEVELPLKLEDYALLKRDDSGKVEGLVSLKGVLGVREVTWPGRIIRTTGEVERGALTAGVVVAVDAIEGAAELRLPPPGLFVKAELDGQSLETAFVVPREAVREGDQVAVVDEEQTIQFRELKVVRSTATEVLVSSGVSAGEKVVLTRISGAVEGMEVEVEESFSGEEEE